MYELPKNRVARNVLFAVSREYAANVMPHLRLHGNMLLYRVEGMKCAVVCYLQGKIFNPTNLLNHVAPPIELIMQI